MALSGIYMEGDAMNPIEAIVVLFISVLIGYLLWRDIRKTNSSPHHKVHMKTYPPLPELVCTCGDCWELNVNMHDICCGCGTIYTVIMTRDES